MSSGCGWQIAARGTVCDDWRGREVCTRHPSAQAPWAVVQGWLANRLANCPDSRACAGARCRRTEDKRVGELGCTVERGLPCRALLALTKPAAGKCAVPAIQTLSAVRCGAARCGGLRAAAAGCGPLHDAVRYGAMRHGAVRCVNTEAVILAM